VIALTLFRLTLATGHAAVLLAAVAVVLVAMVARALWEVMR